jgi:WD40 repeat protein/serine/threonine protein kinase
MADYVGKQLGNYRVVRLLGRGGFATVYLGEHLYLKSYAALKVLNVSLSEREAQHFQAEAQTLVRLEHPHIVRVLEFYVEHGMPILVMQQAVGGTLRDACPRGARLPLSKVVSYISQASSALQYAHNQSLIHRDVKPENLLLDSRGEILLSDFGLALFAPSPEMLSTQERAGTIPYMAPEQISGKPVFASDQYALSCVAYEWLCGTRPFKGAYWELVYKQMYVEPTPLRELAPEIPEAIEAVVFKALKKNAHERFVSVQAFAQALERAYQQSQLGTEDEEDTMPLKIIAHLPVNISTPSPSKPVPVAPSVFLSASPTDEKLLLQLRADLERQGISCLPDPVRVSATTQNPEQMMSQAIRAASAMGVVVSAQTLSSHIVQEHLRIARIYEKPLLYLYVEGANMPQFLLDAWGQRGGVRVFDARGQRYTMAVSELVEYLKSSPSLNVRSPFLQAYEETTWEPRNPYKGLNAFTQRDEHDFFGRDALVEQLIEQVKDMLDITLLRQASTKLLAVVGPSGSGKSSAVMAGLLPKLQAGAVQGSDRWIYLQPMLPGAHPLESLLFTLAPHFPRYSVSNIRADLSDDSTRGLYWLAIQLCAPTKTRVVLFIDQFEELFTQAVSRQERRHFIDLLVNAITQPDSPLIVILTLRADFSDGPMHYPDLHRAVEAHRVPIQPMSLEDLRAAIEQPAALPDVRLTFEGTLVGDILLEVVGQVGALPLLAFTLDQLFRRRRGHVLTMQAYQDIGGVKGALAKQAEEVYTSLPSDAHRRLARVLFLRLISPGQSVQETTRRRARIEELALPDQKETVIIGAVADAFVAGRLLTTNQVEGITTIEVSHEALIREWPRLAEWLREAREDVALQQAINADASEWLQRNKPVDRLYRGTQLIEAQAWAERNTPNRNELMFLQVSADEHERREHEELLRQGRELKLKRQTVNRLRGLVAVLTLLLVGSIIFAVIAQFLVQQANMARDSARESALIAATNAREADARALAASASNELAQEQLDLALLLSVKAVQTDPTSYEARNSLLAALEHSPQIVTMLRSGQQSPIWELAFGTKDTFVATDGTDVYVWKLSNRSGPEFVLKHTMYVGGYVGGVAISPDGQTLAISNATGVWLWSIQTGQSAMLDGNIPVPPHAAPSTPLAFSPDGQSLASARCTQFVSNAGGYLCTGTRVSRWNIQSRQSLTQYVVNAKAETTTFSPDGKLLAFSSGKNVQIVQVATGQVGAPFPCNTDAITNVAFSPDTTTLACGSGTGIQIVNIATGQSSAPLKGYTGALSDLVFSPNGRTVAASSIDQRVYLWNAESGQLIRQLTGDATSKHSIAFSSDNQTLVSGSQDGTIIVWNLAAESPIGQQLAETGAPSSLAITADGSQIAVGSAANGEVLLYDVKTGRVVDTFDTTRYPILTQSPSDNVIQSLALSGNTLAAARLDGTIVAWNISTKQSFKLVPPSPHALYQIALSADGNTLAASEGGDNVTLWDVATQLPIRTLPYQVSDETATLPLALSPDGKLLAVGGCGGTAKFTDAGCTQGQIQLWDVTTGKLVKQFFGHDFVVFSVAFSQDGQTLASSSVHDVLLWDVATGKSQGGSLSLPDGSTNYPFSNLLFSPQGTELALSLENGPNQTFSFALWNVAQQQLVPGAISTNDTYGGGIAFSPDGTQLLSVATLLSNANQGLLMRWDITPASWQQEACAIANNDLTKAQWQQYVKWETSQSKVCSNLAT